MGIKVATCLMFITEKGGFKAMNYLFIYFCNYDQIVSTFTGEINNCVFYD